MTEDETVGWHHPLNGHEFQPTPGESEGEGSVACCSPRDCRVGHDIGTAPPPHSNMKSTAAQYNTEKQWPPLQHSRLENPMDRGAWWAAVQGVTKSQTRLSDSTLTFHVNALEKEMATHSSVLPGESQGRGSLMGCRLWGCTESDMTEAT